MLRLVALTLTAVTGFTALAYEVAWQRYLAVLLGAHSEATAAVLALFLGGLSAGYWIFGEWTRRAVERARQDGRPPALLTLYGVVEASIGVYALVFPWWFEGVHAISLGVPVGAGMAAFATDVALAALLVAPPAVLMGATIPVLTQALARNLEDATRLHALVYTLNTAGAFAGALAAAFVLVPTLGLDGIARAMGSVNVVVGLGYVALDRLSRPVSIDFLVAQTPLRNPTRTHAIAAVSIGFATMTCQTVLIRIGGLALGSSEFTFAMVVAAFVSSIAVGSLGVALLPRIDRFVLPATLWAVVLAFGVLYGSLDEAPYWGHRLRTIFESNDGAFYPFYGAALLATLVIVAPAGALAGAALPLLFDAERKVLGELGASAGRLYSQNTIGSLLGALAGGYALLFWLDLHQVFRIALAAFALSAAIVTARVYASGRSWVGAALVTPALAALVLLPPWNPSHLSAGLFRTRTAQAWTHRGPDAVPARDFLSYEDDPISTVAVMDGSGDSVSILVNGKSDGNTEADLQTMALAGMIPAVLADRTERAFVIGYGTGVTAGYLAELDPIQRVTVAEISPAVLRAAPHFDFANFGASHHPKIELVRSDAYRALLRQRERFDVIVSEPSNPWVAGVEMLFSRDFLEAARDRLAPGGVYVQWYHAYETSDRAIALVLQTYAEVFERVAVWQSNAADLLILGFEDGAGAVDLDRVAERLVRPDTARLFARLGIDNMHELLVHERVPEGVIHATPRADLPAHTLLHPSLSYEASRGFFAGLGASLPFTGFDAAARVGRHHSLLRRHLRSYGEAIPDRIWDETAERACRTHLPHCATLLAAWSKHAERSHIQRRVVEWEGRIRRGPGLDQLAALADLYSGATRGAVTPERARRLTELYRQHYYHAFPFPRQTLLSTWERCRQGRTFSESCQKGLADARALTSGVRPRA